MIGRSQACRGWELLRRGVGSRSLPSGLALLQGRSFLELVGLRVQTVLITLQAMWPFQATPTLVALLCRLTGLMQMLPFHDLGNSPTCTGKLFETCTIKLSFAGKTWQSRPDSDLGLRRPRGVPSFGLQAEAEERAAEEARRKPQTPKSPRDPKRSQESDQVR